MIRRRLLLLLGVTAGILAVAGVAWAFWTTLGSGTGSATAGTLNPPTGLTAPATSTGTVHLTWTASTGTPAPTGYYITRINESDSSTAAACGTSQTSTVSNTACDDLSVPSGSYHYTATAVYHGWTATSPASGSVTVTNRVLTSITINTAAATISAGDSQSYTATGYDQYGVSMGDVTASTTFSISPDGSCTGASCTATVADSGSSHHTVTGNDSGKTAAATLTVNPAGATGFTVAGLTSPTSAGAAHTYTVTAKDPFGNTATGYRGTAHFTSTDGQAVLPADYTFTAADNGARGGFSATLKTAGSQSITATDTVTGSITGAQSGITVNPLTASRLALAAATTTPAAGAADNLTITALDTYGNTATGYTGDKSLTFTGANTIGTFIPTVSNKLGTAVNFGTAETITFSGGVAGVSGTSNGVMTLYKSGAASIVVTDGSISNGTGLSVTVAAASASRLALAAVTTTPTAGAADNLTITALDTYGNTATGYTGDKSLTFSGASTIGSFIPTVSNKSGTAVNFDAAETITFGGGVASVSGSSNGVMTLYKSGAASIVVTDGSISNGTGLSVTVAPSTASRLALAAVTTTPTAGAADNLTITALDTYGNTATGYTGDKSLTFSGASTIGSFIPTVSNKSGTAVNFGTAETITFSGGVASVSGSSNGVMTLYKSGAASIVVTDGSISNSTGLSVTVVPAAASKLVFTTQPGNDSGTGAFSPQPQVSVEDTFGNVENADSSTTVTLAIATGPGTLACYTNGSNTSNLTATVSAGLAAFSGCGINQAATGDTLKATSNPTHGTVTSSTFNVAVSAPTITFPTSSSKETVTNTTTATFTVTGSNFASGARVTLSGGFTNTTWIWLDATHISVTTTAKGAGQRGAYDLTVTNPDGGTVTSTGSMVNG